MGDDEKDYLRNDNWLRVVKAKELLGRDLTPEEELDVWENGLLADCVRHLAPKVTLDQEPLELDEEAAAALKEVQELWDARSFSPEPKRDDD